MNTEWLKRINVGDTITASLLNKITSAINANTRAVKTPRQIDESDDTFSSGGSSGGSIGDEIFDSVSGTETTVTATDSNGDTVDIERVDIIEFQEQASGRTMTLNITYPL